MPGMAKTLSVTHHAAEQQGNADADDGDNRNRGVGQARGRCSNWRVPRPFERAVRM